MEGTEAGDVLWGMGGMRWTGADSGGRAEKKKGELAPGFDLKMEEGRETGAGRGGKQKTMEGSGENLGRISAPA